MSENRKKLIIIDTMALIFRAYYAMSFANKNDPKNIQNVADVSDKEPSGAVFGFISMLLKILEVEQPDYIVAAWDMPAPTFRAEMFTEYKANRTAPPDDLRPQFDFIKELLAVMKIVSLGVSGFEADDVIATISRDLGISNQAKLDIYIISGDRDLLQLITSNVFLVTMPQGYDKRVIYNQQTLFDKYQLRAEQIVDWKSLTGDVSDNIPGVLGIGDKTARSLLIKYDNLDQIYGNITEIPLGTRNKLLVNKKMAYFSQSLVILKTIPLLKFKLDDFNYQIPDFSLLKKYCQRFHITAFDKRIIKMKAWLAQKYPDEIANILTVSSPNITNDADQQVLF